MNDLRARAFGAGHEHGPDHHHDQHDHDGPHRHDDRGLYVLTATLGVLLGGEVLFGWLGWESWRAPGGVSLALAAALLGGVRIVYGALEGLFHGRIGADVALAQACVAALAIGQPFVAAEVVFIALVGEVLEAVTFARAQRAIHRLLDQAPRTARVRRDGEEMEVAAADVRVGDLVIVRPGEKVPVDGTVVAGRTTVDQSALTGEPIGVDRGPGEPVYTGSLNQFGAIEVQAERVGHETTLGQVLRLVADAQRRKAPLERTADRLARLFLPVVEVAAGLTLAAGYLLGWPDVWFRTVAVLVVACPCALVLATPAAVMASMAWLARHGILIKGGAALERLAGCDVLGFDKTGTLTLGRPEVSTVLAFGDRTEATVLGLAATAEAASTHPLASAITRESAARGVRPWTACESEALPGAGVRSTFREGPDAPERQVLVGNPRLLAECGLSLEAEALEALAALDGRGETPLIVVVDGEVAGLIGARDAVRPEAHDVVHELRHLGFRHVALLTGDRAPAARRVARAVHIGQVEAELDPTGKVRWVEQTQADGRRVAMVGDGINDAPALAAAHVGIALGGIGADLAAEAGDVVLLGEPLRPLPDLVRLSRATVRVVRQNILVFAFGLNAVAMTSAALGWLGPVAAALLHQAGSLLVLLNAMRLLAFGSPGPVQWLRAASGAVGRLDDRLDPTRVLDWLLAHWRRAVGIAMAAGAVAYLTSGVAAIGPGEIGLVQRFGRHVATLGPGLHLRLPPPIEAVRRLEPARVRSLTVGPRLAAGLDAADTGWGPGAGQNRPLTAGNEGTTLLMTGDGQLVEVMAVAQYRLDLDRPEALRAFAFGVAGPELALGPLAEAAVRAVVARAKLEDLLTSGRRAAERAAGVLLQARADAARLGLTVTSVSFQDVHPPLTVLDAYRDVSRAGSDRDRRVNEARAYQAEAEAKARGQAAATVDRAEAQRAAAVDRAAAEADVFRELSRARTPQPDLTDRRFYWDRLEESLAGRPKLLLEPGRDRPRHLIVPGQAGGLISPPIPLPAGVLVGPPRPPG